MRESNNSLKIFFISIPTSPHLSSHVYLKTAEDRSLEQRYSTFRQTTIAQVTQTRKNQTTKESVNRCWIVYSIAITIISRDHQSSEGPLSETASHASSSAGRSDFCSKDSQVEGSTQYRQFRHIRWSMVIIFSESDDFSILMKKKRSGGCKV